jgi:urea transporter
MGDISPSKVQLLGGDVDTSIDEDDNKESEIINNIDVLLKDTELYDNDDNINNNINNNNLNNNHNNKSRSFQDFRNVILSPSRPNLKNHLRLQIQIKHDNIIVNIYNLILFSIDIILRSIGQVFLCDNPLSGLLIAIGVGCSSIELIICGIVGVIFANIGAYYFGSADINDISSGMCGYDGALTGCGCYVFLNHSDNIRAFIFILIFLSTITGFIHVSCTNFMNFYNLPALTMAFNVTTLMFLISLSQDKTDLLSFNDSSNTNIDDNYADMSILFLLDATCRGVGQFIFADTTYGGIIIILGIALESKTGASCAVLGSFLACITSYYILQVPDLDSVRVLSIYLSLKLTSLSISN